MADERVLSSVFSRKPTRRARAFENPNLFVLGLGMAVGFVRPRFFWIRSRNLGQKLHVQGLLFRRDVMRRTVRLGCFAQDVMRPRPSARHNVRPLCVPPNRQDGPGTAAKDGPFSGAFRNRRFAATVFRHKKTSSARLPSGGQSSVPWHFRRARVAKTTLRAHLRGSQRQDVRNTDCRSTAFRKRRSSTDFFHPKRDRQDCSKSYRSVCLRISTIARRCAS